MASTKALAAMRRRSGQSRLSHAAPRVVSDAVFMLMLASWSVVGAIKLAAAKDIGNSTSRHWDAASPDASRNGFSAAQGPLGMLLGLAGLALRCQKRRARLSDFWLTRQLRGTLGVVEDAAFGARSVRQSPLNSRGI